MQETEQQVEKDSEEPHKCPLELGSELNETSPLSKTKRRVLKLLCGKPSSVESSYEAIQMLL